MTQTNQLLLEFCWRAVFSAERNARNQAARLSEGSGGVDERNRRTKKQWYLSCSPLTPLRFLTLTLGILLASLYRLKIPHRPPITSFLDKGKVYPKWTFSSCMEKLFPNGKYQSPSLCTLFFLLFPFPFPFPFLYHCYFVN